MPQDTHAGGWHEPRATALLVLADGTVLEGFGIGATGESDGEVCFNTAMTGYQEILTDPSYAGQIVTFTFPHIGNVGTNEEDIESVNAAASSGVRGVVLGAPVTDPSSWRATRHLDAWLKRRGIVGLTGVDTRALTALIRDKGMPNAVIAHDPTGNFDVEALKARAAGLHPMDGLDLVPMVDSGPALFLGRDHLGARRGLWPPGQAAAPRRRDRLRRQAQHPAAPRRRPAARSPSCRRRRPPRRCWRSTPDGVFLSNGPGDPAATGEYAVPVIRRLLDERVPTFGICLGHQMLGLAVGGAHRQDAPGPPRREPSGQGHGDRQGRDHLDEPRLRGRSGEPAGDGGRRPMSRSSTARTAASR